MKKNLGRFFLKPTFLYNLQTMLRIFYCSIILIIKKKNDHITKKNLHSYKEIIKLKKFQRPYIRFYILTLSKIHLFPYKYLIIAL